MAIVVYAPALALAQVTGLNVYVSVSLICFVCIFYTTLGGMKAVLWTDAIQVRLVIKGDKCYLSSGKALKIKVVDDVMVWGEHGSRGNDITIAVYYISDIGDEDDDSNNEGNRSNDDENIIGNVANTNNYDDGNRNDGSNDVNNNESNTKNIFFNNSPSPADDHHVRQHDVRDHQGRHRRGRLRVRVAEERGEWACRTRELRP